MLIPNKDDLEADSQFPCLFRTLCCLENLETMIYHVNG